MTTRARSRVVFDPILIDLDGTLVDSGPAIMGSMREACRQVGVDLHPSTDLRWCVGPPLEQTLARLVGAALVPRAVVAYREVYVAALRSGSPTMPGARAAIRALTLAGVDLAVVTYKPTELAVEVLERAKLRPAFRTVVGREPHSDDRTKAALLKVGMETLQPHRERPVYVGDHTEDGEAAAACGIDFLPFGPMSWPEIVRAVVILD